MATIKGQNLRIFIGGKPIAAALQCSLSVQAGVAQISSKDDVNSFAQHTVVSLAWSLKANGVVSIDADRNDTASLLDRMGQTVSVELALASGDKNSTEGDIILSGDAIITDVQITAENRRRGLYDLTLTGKKNMLFPLRVLRSSQQHVLRTSNGKVLVAQHEV